MTYLGGVPHYFKVLKECAAKNYEGFGVCVRLSLAIVGIVCNSEISHDNDFHHEKKILHSSERMWKVRNPLQALRSS